MYLQDVLISWRSLPRGASRELLVSAIRREKNGPKALTPVRRYVGELIARRCAIQEGDHTTGLRIQRCYVQHVVLLSYSLPHSRFRHRRFNLSLTLSPLQSRGCQVRHHKAKHAMLT